MMSDPTSAVVSSCEYWMRIAISLHLCVKKALLDILHDQSINGLPRDEKQLYQRLYHFQNNLPSNLKKVIQPFQWDKMCHKCSNSCPSQCLKQGKTSSEDLDITCIVILITNLTALSPPQGGWKNPNPNDTSRAAYVLLARALRNDINHCSVGDISTEQEFKNLWLRVESILRGLQFNDMKLFRELEATSLDGKTDLKIIALSDRMHTIRDLMESEYKNVGHDVNRVNGIVKSLKEQVNGLEIKSELHGFQARELKQNIQYLEILTMIRINQLEERVGNIEEKLQQEIFDEKELSNHLKESTEKKYQNVFLTLLPKSPLHPPKPTRRDDVVVGLTLIKDAETAFFQAAQNSYDKEEDYSKGIECGNYRDTPSVIQKMRSELDETSSSQDTNYDDIMMSESSYVIVSGTPGCGKTTLCESLAYKWACNKMWNIDPNFQFVFLLKFRDLNRFKNDESVTTEKILSHFYPNYFNGNLSLKKSTLLILDGFDENFNKYDLLHSEDNYTSFILAIFDLLNPYNENLPYARLITSRPAACSILFRLLAAHQFSEFRCFEITGFSLENIKLYINQFWSQQMSLKENRRHLNTQDEKLQGFLSKVESTPTLRSMMTIPFFCKGVCFLMLDSEIDSHSIPMTFTGLFSNLLTLFLRDHGLRNTKLSLKQTLEDSNTKPIILTLSKFAFLMEKVNKIIFTERDILHFFGENNNVEDILKKSGLVIKIEADDEENSFYQFLHYSFHEFLVAIYTFHTLSIERIYNPNIIQMVGGLAGGLVHESRSNLFVQRIAKMLKSTDVLSLERILQKSSLVGNAKDVIFEYENKINLKFCMFYLQNCHGQFNALVKRILQGDLYIENAVVPFYSGIRFAEISAFVEAIGHFILLIDDDYIKKAISWCQKQLPENRHCDKLIIQQYRGTHIRAMDIEEILLLSNYTKNIEYILIDTQQLSSTRIPISIPSNLKASNFTLFINILGFKIAMIYSEEGDENLMNLCRCFQTFTIAFTNVDPSYLALRSGWNEKEHTHSAACLSDDFIKEAKAIAYKYRHIENLHFIVSCINGSYRHNIPYNLRISKDNLQEEFKDV